MAATTPHVERSVLDGFLPHFDAAIRQQVLLPASREQTYAWLRRFDFAPLAVNVGRAVEDFRALPPLVAQVAHQSLRLPPTASLMLDDALRLGMVLLSERPDQHVVLGAVGKLWKPNFELVRLDPDAFAGFHEAKYVKLAIAFTLQRYGAERTRLRHESRFLATDDSARAHFLRFWRVADPYACFFMRRAMELFKQVAVERRAEIAPGPPWRARRAEVT